jgi:hypothetical protein
MSIVNKSCCSDNDYRQYGLLLLILTHVIVITEGIRDPQKESLYLLSTDTFLLNLQ